MSAPSARRHLWLAAALVLLVGAGWLTWMAEGRHRATARPNVQFPLFLREAERERVERRRTLPSRPVDRPNSAPSPRDPLLAALPPTSAQGVMVVELNALRHSPVGELLVDCLRQRGGDALGKLKREANIDPLEDVDRVAITDDGVIVSGFFGRANWTEMTKQMTASPYGGGRLYTDEAHHEAVGVWHDELVVVADTPEQVKRALDRLDDRNAPAPPPILPESQTYGEAYGVLPGQALKKMLGIGREDIGQRLAELASRVEFHLDAAGDVALVAQVRGDDADGLADLAKSVGGALSLTRISAKAQGDDDFAELLDFARVVPNGHGFSIEVAVPLAVLERQLAWCRTDGGVAPR